MKIVTYFYYSVGNNRIETIGKKTKIIGIIIGRLTETFENTNIAIIKYKSTKCKV